MYSDFVIGPDDLLVQVRVPPSDDPYAPSCDADGLRRLLSGRLRVESKGLDPRVLAVLLATVERLALERAEDLLAASTLYDGDGGSVTAVPAGLLGKLGGMDPGERRKVGLRWERRSHLDGVGVLIDSLVRLETSRKTGEAIYLLIVV